MGWAPYAQLYTANDSRQPDILFLSIIYEDTQIDDRLFVTLCIHVFNGRGYVYINIFYPFSIRVFIFLWSGRTVHHFCQIFILMQNCVEFLTVFCIQDISSIVQQPFPGVQGGSIHKGVLNIWKVSTYIEEVSNVIGLFQLVSD